MKKSISILGSTGSIGTSALEVVRFHSDSFSIYALGANSNVALLEKQILEFKPKVVAVFDQKAAEELRKKNLPVAILSGISGMCEIAAAEPVDFVINAIVGLAGLEPTISAIKKRKRIGLANKEVLVAAGEYVMALVEEYGVDLLPIDSEHNAIFQCLEGRKKSDIRRIILTASGGPFRLTPEAELDAITPEKALKHPTWNMGRKITIDSSTLFNKGLEMIEAKYLFGISEEKIEIVFHPQSIIHSMVEFIDGSIMAQLNQPNMINPIQFAMCYPEKKSSLLPYFDFTKSHNLEFYPPNTQRFKALPICYGAVKKGGSLPCFLNSANEVLVERFLNKEISWKGISEKLETLLVRHQKTAADSIEKILQIDALARKEASEV